MLHMFWATWDDIKSHRKPGFHPLFRRHLFRKTTVGGQIKPSRPPPPPILGFNCSKLSIHGYTSFYLINTNNYPETFWIKYLKSSPAKFLYKLSKKEFIKFVISIILSVTLSIIFKVKYFHNIKLIIKLIIF